MALGLQLHRIMLSLLTCSLFLWVTSLKPLAHGYWFQTESALLGLQAICLLLTVFLGIAYYYYPRSVTQSLINPACLSALGIAILSALLSPFITLWKTTFFGAPELGEGVFWFLDLSILIASTRFLLPLKKNRLYLAVAALISAILVTILSTFTLHKPYYFQAYLAFYGIFLYSILYKVFRCQHTYYLWGSFFLCSLLILCSANKTAILLWPLSLLFLKIPWKKINKNYALGLVFLSPIFLWGSLNVLASAYSPHLPPSLWSRYQLSQRVLQFVQAHPLTLLTGQGWGFYPDAAIDQISIQDFTLFYDEAQLTPERPFWEFLLHRSPFHSHNEWMEGLLSAGIGGLLLVCLLYLSPLLGAPTTLLPLALSTSLISSLLASLWFQTPLTLPFMGLAWGFCLGSSKSTQRHPRTSVIAGFILAIGGLSWGLYAQFNTIQKDKQLKNPPLYTATAAPTCGDGLIDFQMNGYRLTSYFRNLSRALKLATPEQSQNHHLFSRVAWLQCVVDRQWQERPSLRLMSADLINYSDWAFYEGEQAVPPSLLTGWDEKAALWAERVPQRSDLLAPYFMWKILHQQEASIQPLLRQILLHRPDDPVALWFSGLYLLSDPNTASQGQARMALARSLGLDAILPLPPPYKE